MCEVFKATPIEVECLHIKVYTATINQQSAFTVDRLSSNHGYQCESKYFLLEMNIALPRTNPTATASNASGYAPNIYHTISFQHGSLFLVCINALKNCSCMTTFIPRSRLWAVAYESPQQRIICTQSACIRQKELPAIHGQVDAR